MKFQNSNSLIVFSEAPAEFVYPNGFGQPKNRLNEKVYFVREDPTHQTILAAVPGLQMKRLFDEMPPGESLKHLIISDKSEFTISKHI